MKTDAAGLDRLLDSGALTEATRKALRDRLTPVPDFAFFNVQEAARLTAVSVCLVPHDPALTPLARCTDERLQNGDTDGWRYDENLPDGEAYRQLLAALPADFETAAPDAQHAALTRVQRQYPRVFEDLLAELTERYYAHPAVQLELGYVGFADARGWTQVGLNQLDPHEADALALAQGQP